MTDPETPRLPKSPMRRSRYVALVLLQATFVIGCGSQPAPSPIKDSSPVQTTSAAPASEPKQSAAPKSETNAPKSAPTIKASAATPPAQAASTAVAPSKSAEPSNPKSSPASKETPVAKSPIDKVASSSTPAKAEPAAVKPAEPTTVKEAAKAHAEPTRPATFTQVVQAIDLRKFAIPKDGVFQERAVSHLYVMLERDVDATTKYVREQMTKLGCTETKSEIPTVPPYVSLAFAKNDFLVSAFLSPDPTGKKLTNVVMTNLGNLDPRTLPVPKGAEPTIQTRSTTTLVTSDKIDQASDAVTKSLEQEGWRRYLRSGVPAVAQDPQQRFLDFFQNGIKVGVYLSASTDQPGKTAIQYNCSLLDAELPLPADAIEVRFGDETGMLSFRSPKALAEVVAFYRKQFASLGWKPMKLGIVNEKLAKVFFQRDNDVAMIEARPDKKETVVELRGLVEKVPDDEKQAMERAEKAAEAKDNNLVDLPLPPDAKDVEYDAESKKVKFKSKSTVKELVDFYQKAFADAGWKERENIRRADDQVGNFSTAMGNDDFLFVNMFRLNATTDTEVNALAYGFQWKKAK